MATYEIGAFTEEELLDQGMAGTNIGYGDQFVMPGSTSVVMEVWDNDSYLSGDSWHNENANDWYGQTATVTEAGIVTSDGNQIYAECYFWVKGSDGCWYIMIEIEVEGQSGDYFSFYGNTPAEGTLLTVWCGGNVRCDWVNYNCLQEPNQITPPLANDDMMSISESETGNLNILSNDVDLDGGTLEVTAVEGGTVGTAFEMFTPEGYSVMVTVHADGTATVVPGPEMEQLTSGETTTVSFNYTITDSDGLTSTAAVTVEINGELTLDAVDDAIVVFENEGAGDADGNVLDNDTIDGEAYTGEVVAAEGDAANVGVWIDGTDGGRIKINADGSFDFDADGDFDALTKDQTAETTFSYQINAQGVVTAAQVQNILFVVDISGSTANSFDGTAVGDLNGDGMSNTILDAQIASYQALSQQLADMNINPDNVNIGLVAFSGSGVNTSGSLNGDAQILGTFKPGDAALNDALTGLNDGGSTNFESALFDANGWMNDIGASTDDNNTVFFLSDGYNNTGNSYSDEVALLEANFGANLIAVGVGNSADLGQLNAIDNTGGAEIVTSTDALTQTLSDALTEVIDITDTATITVTVQGMSEVVAVADAITVFESEMAGETETLDSGATSVLANDTKDGNAFTGTVDGVNGDAANVGQVVAGDNGGLLVINADGTVDFDANGEFEALIEGQNAETTFTYTIEDGKTATVTVTVKGESDYAAIGDVLTVSESEGAGLNTLDDGSVSVLVNDIKDDGAYNSAVLGVNGAAANVGQVVTGDNGGLLTINADGTLDFDANGDFEALTDDDTAVTTFTYEIEDGKTATVTVNVTGETDYFAVNDTMTVSASEAAGDADLLDSGEDSVLDNDFTDAGDYLGNVLSVNTDPSNIGQAVTGTNGGLLIINADGTLDFDANGDFASLIDGQSADTIFTYEIEDGKTASVTVTVEGETVRMAHNDVINVLESETAGDAELLSTGDDSVLDNDVQNGGDYTDVVGSVNGSIGNVNSFVAGSNGGLLKVNADGTVDFDANGDFDLAEGAIATTEFTYTLISGEEATITVNVTGEADYVAVDDVLTVTEAAKSGNFETLDNLKDSLLANDSLDGNAYPGEVLSVNGDAANIEMEVLGDNGGKLTVFKDGTIDFDAADEFNYLDAGETAVTKFTYGIDGGQTATLQVNVLGQDDETGGGDATINLAVVLSNFQTMYTQSQAFQLGAPDFLDWNGNGVENEVADLAYLMVSDFLNEAFDMAAAAGKELNLALISFNEGSGENEQYVTVVNSDTAQSDLDAHLAANDSPAYSQAFSNADAWFTDVDTPNETNAMYVIGNGLNVDNWQSEYDAMVANHTPIIESYLPDVDFVGADAAALNSLDTQDQFADQIFTDDPSFAAMFGLPAAQDALDLDNFV